MAALTRPVRRAHSRARRSCAASCSIRFWLRACVLRHVPDKQSPPIVLAHEELQLVGDPARHARCRMCTCCTSGRRAAARRRPVRPLQSSPTAGSTPPPASSPPAAPFMLPPPAAALPCWQVLRAARADRLPRDERHHGEHLFKMIRPCRRCSPTSIRRTRTSTAMCSPATRQ